MDLYICVLRMAMIGALLENLKKVDGRRRLEGEKKKKISTTFSLPDLVLGFRMPIILLATLENSMLNYVTRGHATSITKWLDPSRGINNVG